MDYMISGPDKALEKPSNGASQPLKAKLQPESRSGNNGPRIKMTKTAPGPTLVKPIQSSSKQITSFTATPRLVASPNSTKSASRRRSIYSPADGPAGTGSPAHKKARQASGSYELNNNKNHVAQPTTYEFASNPSKRADQLPVIAPFLNGNHARHTTKDVRNGIDNGSLAGTTSQTWDYTESDSWLPLQINRTNGLSSTHKDSKHAENGILHNRSANQRWEENSAPSLFHSYSETNSLQASNGLSAANGLSQDAIRASAFDNFRGPRNKASPTPKSASKLDTGTARRTLNGLSTKTRPRASKDTIETVINVPPLEAQRERLAQARSADSSSLDALIYNQEGAAEPPPGVIIPEAQPRPVKDPRFFAHIDPRIHWCRPHSKEWHEKKQAEIKERGGRKANFGKAAERLKKQRLENPIPEEDLLPERVRENPEWMRAQAWFKECSQKDWEKDKEATKRADAEAKLKAKTGRRR